ncbi:MAG TPA: CHAT domain-containing protein [Kofleriaceae bacterium]
MTDVRIVFLSANVSRSEAHRRDAMENSTTTPNLAWLDIDREYNEIQHALGFPGLRGLPVIEMIPAVQWSQFSTILQEATSSMVLHFSGHGDATGGLYMRSELGTPIAIPAESLVDQMRRFHRRLPLVVLNACYTDDLAQRLIDDVQVVIGMEHRVTDDAAILFSTTFYRSLVLHGVPIAEAFDDACITVDGRYRGQHGHARIRRQIGVDPRSMRLFQIPLRDMPSEHSVAACIDGVLRDLAALRELDRRSTKDCDKLIARLSAIEQTTSAALGALGIADRYSIGGNPGLAQLARKLTELGNRASAIAGVLHSAMSSRAPIRSTSCCDDGERRRHRSRCVSAGSGRRRSRT